MRNKKKSPNNYWTLSFISGVSVIQPELWCTLLNQAQSVYILNIILGYTLTWSKIMDVAAAYNVVLRIKQELQTTRWGTVGENEKSLYFNTCPLQINGCHYIPEGKQCDQCGNIVLSCPGNSTFQAQNLRKPLDMFLMHKAIMQSNEWLLHPETAVDDSFKPQKCSSALPVQMHFF